jgi:hypothetical protein
MVAVPFLAAVNALVEALYLGPTNQPQPPSSTP